MRIAGLIPDMMVDEQRALYHNMPIRFYLTHKTDHPMLLMYKTDHFSE